MKIYLTEIIGLEPSFDSEWAKSKIGTFNLHSSNSFDDRIILRQVATKDFDFERLQIGLPLFKKTIESLVADFEKTIAYTNSSPEKNRLRKKIIAWLKALERDANAPRKVG